MEIAFRILLFIIGACFGSFLCCQARRLRYNSTHKSKLNSPRSVCLSCKKNLKWYDNVPIISWLLLKGKCRNCGKKIGLAELLSELLTSAAFLLLSFSINLQNANHIEWLIFVAVLILTLLLIFLAIYDGLYGELPTLFLILSIILASVILALKITSHLISHPLTLDLIINPILAILILAGLYLFLYLVSHGKWVGDGDWLLALSIAMVVAHPYLALLVLFLANFSATLISLPRVKSNRRAKIHFGPFLVFAFVITYSFSPFFITFML